MTSDERYTSAKICSALVNRYNRILALANHLIIFDIMAKSLLRSTGIVSAMTMISRIVGFIRDMVIAQMFGAGFALDAFFVAFKIPNFMRRLFAEGAFSQAFVPVLSEHIRSSNEQEIRCFISHILGMLGAVLLLVTLVAEISTPFIISVFAPGFLQDPTRFALASDMLKITFPYIFFISITAMFGAILNTFNRFAIPALTPVLLNLSMIWAAFFLSPYLNSPVTALAWGVLIAGVVQLLFQLPFLWRLRLLPIPKLKPNDAGVKKVLTLMLPALFGVSVAQISILIDTLFASFLPPGSVSWLYFSDRMTNLPLGVFGVAIATVILPNLSKRYAEKSDSNYQATLDWGIRMVLLIGVPASLALCLLAGPILITLFYYGNFLVGDVIMTQHSVWAFAYGIPAFMLVKVLASAFYARQNIKTPVKVAVIALVCNMLFNTILIIPLQHVGLALSTTAAAFINASVLLYLLQRHKIFRPQLGWVNYLLQLLFANAVLGIFLWYSSDNVQQWLIWSVQTRVMHLLILVFGGIFSYFFALYAVGFRWQNIRPQVIGNENNS